MEISTRNREDYYQFCFKQFLTEFRTLQRRELSLFCRHDTGVINYYSRTNVKYWRECMCCLQNICLKKVIQRYCYDYILIVPRAIRNCLYQDVALAYLTYRVQCNKGKMINSVLANTISAWEKLLRNSVQAKRWTIRRCKNPPAEKMGQSGGFL